MTPSSQSLALVRSSRGGLIYAAENLTNGKLYVGKTVTLLCARKASHKNKSENGSKLPFHEALRKYGVDGFRWVVLQRCASNALLNEAEKWWISALRCQVKRGYNVASGGDGSALGTREEKVLGKTRKRRKPLTDEQRARRSEIAKRYKAKPESIAKMVEKQKGQKRPSISGKNHPKFGKPTDESVRKKISASLMAKTPEEERQERKRESRRRSRQRAREKKGKRDPKPRGTVKGTKFTDEHKKKISEALAGRPHPWQAGIKFNDERKKKISEALKGKPHPWQKGRPSPNKGGFTRSEETKAKLSASHKGKKKSAEWLENNRLAQIGKHVGEKNYWFGRHRSDETKRKIGDANRRIWAEKKSSGNAAQGALDFD